MAIQIYDTLDFIFPSLRLMEVIQITPIHCIKSYLQLYLLNAFFCDENISQGRIAQFHPQWLIDQSQPEGQFNVSLFFLIKSCVSSLKAA